MPSSEGSPREANASAHKSHIVFALSSSSPRVSPSLDNSMPSKVHSLVLVLQFPSLRQVVVVWLVPFNTVAFLSPGFMRMA